MHPLTLAPHRFSSLDVVVSFEHVPSPSFLFAMRESPRVEDDARQCVPASTCARGRAAADVRCRSPHPKDQAAEPALLWELLRTLVKGSPTSDVPAEATQHGALVANDAEAICLRRAA